MIADHLQREQALNPQHSFIVQAPAGSGKTELLTRRYLVLLAQVKYPEEIIAITFTRKAAAEMRLRVLEALQLAQLPAPDVDHAHQTWELARAALQQQEKMQWNLLANPNRLRIQTIDSLCSSLTRQMPILSRFGAQPDIAEDANKLYQSAAREILNSLEHETPWTNSLVNLLLHLDNDHEKVEQLLADMLKRRDQWLSHVISAQNKPDQLRQLSESALQLAIDITLTKLRTSFSAEIIKELLILARFAGNQLTAISSDSPITHCRDLQTLPDSQYTHCQAWLELAELLLTKDNSWRARFTIAEGFPAPSNAKSRIDKELFKTMKERMQSVILQLSQSNDCLMYLTELRILPPPFYSDSQWQILTALLELLPVLAAQLQLIFQTQGVVDYSEVAQNALIALGDPQAPTDLALALDYRIQHILVDEFQDTSIAQFRLLEQLTAGWQPDDGRTLFLVGDPMQSIYRFRKAEVSLFLQARNRGIGAIQLQPLALQVNFRSTPNITQWINKTFATLMPTTDDIDVGAVTYTPAIAGPNIVASNQTAIHFHCVADDNAQTEANLITQLVQSLLAKNPQESIAILVRARAHLTAILPALQAANIIYRAVEIETLQEKPVIKDLLALTRALLHPADRMAWLAILRAPWCGLTLADLHILVDGDYNTPIWQRLQLCVELGLSTDGQERLKQFVTVVRQSLQQKQRQSLARWIEGAWLALGGPACLTDIAELNDAQKFFDLLTRLENGGTITDFEHLNQKLATLYAAPITHSTVQVEVMTMHKAKGLEFDTVILPALERTAGKSDAQLLACMERPTTQGKIDLILAPIKAREDERDPIYDYLRAEDKKRAAYETVRLLYVAATRAKKALHLVATVAYDTEGKINPPTENSLLGKLWPAVAADFKAQVHGTPQNSTAVTTESIAIATTTPLTRLQTHWQLPATAYGLKPVFTKAKSIPKNEANYFVWNSNRQRLVGTVIHQLLQQICLDGLNQWDVQTLANKRSHFQTLLIAQGLPPVELESATNTVLQALHNTLTDERGMWILSPHTQHTAEYPLTLITEKGIKQVIIDRTFVDNTDTRWIIDYKIPALLDAEASVYRPQLENYARIMQSIDQRPIKLGLYFPLSSAWHEWEYVKQSELIYE